MLAPRPGLRHRFDVPIAEARRLQERLRALVVESDRLPDPVRRVAGADVSYDRRAPHLFAAVVVVDTATGAVVETAAATAEARFPYVPGFLSFRELPALLAAFARLRGRPDLVIADAHGRSHPRRFGLACHLGVLLDVPVIGVAKSPLVGTHREPGPRRGAHVRLHDGGETIGELVRTREGVRPVYVSIGHRVSLATARAWTLRLASRHRLPEPVRAAHVESNRLRRAACGDGPAPGRRPRPRAAPCAPPS